MFRINESPFQSFWGGCFWIIGFVCSGRNWIISPHIKLEWYASFNWQPSHSAESRWSPGSTSHSSVLFVICETHCLQCLHSPVISPCVRTNHGESLQFPGPNQQLIRPIKTYFNHWDKNISTLRQKNILFFETKNQSLRQKFFFVFQSKNISLFDTENISL